MKFNNRLAEILAEQNLKQADLCRMTGISTALMSNYMTGKASPSLDNALMIAKALGITLDYLVGRKSDSTSLSKVKTMLLSDFEELNDDGQNAIMFMLGSLKKSHPRQRRNSGIVQANIGNGNVLTVGDNNSYKF